MDLGLDDDYDPEAVFAVHGAGGAGGAGVALAGSDDDDYDPERVPLPTERPSSRHPQALLQALDAVLHSDIVRHPAFLRLSQMEQADLVASQVNELYAQSHQSASVPSFNSPSPVPVSVSNPCYGALAVTPATVAAPAVSHIPRSCADAVSEPPLDARVYVGNLPHNYLCQGELFRIFRKYGDIVEISIKSGYGFVQYSSARESRACILQECGRWFHGRTLLVKQCNPPQLEQNNLGPQSQSPSVLVFISPEASTRTRETLVRELLNAALTYQVHALDDRPVADLMSDVAHAGIPALCIVHHDAVSVHIFSATDDGNIRFDEYANVDPRIATHIVCDAVYPLSESQSMSRLLSPSHQHGQNSPTDSVSGATYEPGHTINADRSPPETDSIDPGTALEHNQPPTTASMSIAHPDTQNAADIHVSADETYVPQVLQTVNGLPPPGALQETLARLM